MKIDSNAESSSSLCVSLHAAVRCARLMDSSTPVEELRSSVALRSRYERAVLRLIARSERVDDGGAADSAVYRTRTGSRVLVVRRGVVIAILGAPARRPIGPVAALRLAREARKRLAR